MRQGQYCFYFLSLYIRVSVYQSVVFTVVASSFLHLIGGKRTSFQCPPALLNYFLASILISNKVFKGTKMTPTHAEFELVCVFVLNVTESMLQTDIQSTVRHADRKSHLLIGRRTQQHARDVLRYELSSEKMHKYVISI